MDTGLSRLLALETLTHGTGLLGYIGINLYGADPSFGAGETDSSVGGGYPSHIRGSKNYFHVFKDSGFHLPVDLPPLLVNTFGNELLPRFHAVLSGMAHFGYSEAYKTGNLVTGTLGAISGFLTPTLKFRFTPEEIDSCFFENDPDYAQAAYRTSHAISAAALAATTISLNTL